MFTQVAPIVTLVWQDSSGDTLSFSDTSLRCALAKYDIYFEAQRIDTSMWNINTSLCKGMNFNN